MLAGSSRSSGAVADGVAGMADRSATGGAAVVTDASAASGTETVEAAGNVAPVAGASGREQADNSAAIAQIVRMGFSWRFMRYSLGGYWKPRL